MATIEFEKYKDAGTGNYTTLECHNEKELASALVNILTNRKKGYPREVVTFDCDDVDDVHIVINTIVTSKKERAIGTSDPTLE